MKLKNQMKFRVRRAILIWIPLYILSITFFAWMMAHYVVAFVE